MSRREILWRVTFGALGLALLVYGALNVTEPRVALIAAFTSALAFFVALDDAVENL